jgi:hypothetical protein
LGQTRPIELDVGPPDVFKIYLGVLAHIPKTDLPHSLLQTIQGVYSIKIHCTISPFIITMSFQKFICELSHQVLVLVFGLQDHLISELEVALSKIE